jgi:hypothetical protein
MHTKHECRLKVLKDEIRKPYFIKLKEFLWEQGVRGPDYISKPVKVYPARESPALTVAVYDRSMTSQRKIYTLGRT